MLKNLIIFLFSASFVMTGCTKKTDELFDKPPDDRIQESLTAYRSALIQSPGWKLFVYPTALRNQGIEVGGLSYYLQFPDSGRVSMVSDFSLETAGVPKESGFRVRAVQRPSLIFDTYSYIHIAADPDPTVSLSPTQAGGYGWGTDFDFSFTQAAPEGDTIRLQGNFNETDAVMIRATQEEMTAAFNGRLAEILNFTSDYSSSNSFLYFPGTDNTKIGVSFNPFLHRINFTYLDGSQLVTVNAPFSHTTYGLHFKEPVTVGGYTFQDAFWDDAAGVYYIMPGGSRIDIINANEPLFPLNVVLGQTITTISVPTTPLPGQSPVFDSVYVAVRDSLKTNGFNLDLREMDFVFDDESRTMALFAYVEQEGTRFIVQYVYSYSLTANSTTSFARVGQNGNAGLVEEDMAPLLEYIENDVFQVEYFTGSTPVLGQFSSLDNPDFFFTGNLR